jgi:hypothetical protein
MTKEHASALHVRCLGQAVVQMRGLRNISRETTTRSISYLFRHLAEAEIDRNSGGWV